MAGGCAIFCAINAAVGVPFLAFLGFLCSSETQVQVEVPDKQKPAAATGCFVASFMYVVTFFLAVFCFKQSQKKASAREVTNAHGGGSRVAVSQANW